MGVPFFINLKKGTMMRYSSIFITTLFTFMSLFYFVYAPAPLFLVFGGITWVVVIIFDIFAILEGWTSSTDNTEAKYLLTLTMLSVFSALQFLAGGATLSFTTIATLIISVVPLYTLLKFIEDRSPGGLESLIDEVKDFVHDFFYYRQK